jgi:hypothetical protein
VTLDQITEHTGVLVRHSMQWLLMLDVHASLA